MLRTFFAFLRLWMWGALLAVLVGPASAKTLAPEENYAGICERFAQRMPRLHLLHLEMGDLVSSRTWTNLIVSLDYERMYFLQSDLDRFRARETHLDDELKNGDMSFAFEVFDVFKARLSNRVEAVGQSDRQSGADLGSRSCSRGLDERRDVSPGWRLRPYGPWRQSGQAEKDDDRAGESPHHWPF